RSILGRKHDCDAGRAVIAGPTHRLQSAKWRNAVEVVVADVNSKDEFAAVTGFQTGPAKHAEDVPEAAILGLADDTVGDQHIVAVNGSSHRDGIPEASFAVRRRIGDIDKDTVLDGLRSCVNVNVAHRSSPL